jgi:micrococcal nuclease
MHEYKAKLLRVVDGDTLDAEIDLGFNVFIKERVRLYGIDTWESRTRDLEEKKKGLAAKARLKELIYNKPFVIKTHKKQKGKYGRILGEIFIKGEGLDEINVNDLLFEEGHACKYYGGNKELARKQSQE